MPLVTFPCVGYVDAFSNPLPCVGHVNVYLVTLYLA